MSRSSCSLGVAVLFATMAVEAWPQQAEGVVTRHSLISARLGREYGYTVYAPPGYGAGGLRYPILYLLHGASGDEKSWLEGARLKAVADSLIGSRLIRPLVIVMPGDSRGWWVDGTSQKSESALVLEVMPDAERRYRVLRGRAGRVLGGLSAGGYGALRLALKYPDRFAAAALLSPAIYSEEPPETSGARLHSQFLGPDGRFSRREWQARNYPALLSSYLAQPARVALYILSGDDDPLGISAESFRLFQTMSAHQPSSVELRIVDGGHDWAVWSAHLGEALQYLSRWVDEPR